MGEGGIDMHFVQVDSPPKNRQGVRLDETTSFNEKNLKKVVLRVGSEVLWRHPKTHNSSKGRIIGGDRRSWRVKLLAEKGDREYIPLAHTRIVECSKKHRNGVRLGLRPWDYERLLHVEQPTKVPMPALGKPAMWESVPRDATTATMHGIKQPWPQEGLPITHDANRNPLPPASSRSSRRSSVSSDRSSPRSTSSVGSRSDISNVTSLGSDAGRRWKCADPLGIGCRCHNPAARRTCKKCKQAKGR